MMMRKRVKRDSGIPSWAYLCLLAVIAIVVVFSAYKLIVWNMGTARTEEDTEEEFDVEILDQVFLLPPDRKAMHEDDGKETILFLGNDILTYYSNEDGVVEKIAKKLGADCIKAGFPESTVALKNAPGDTSNDLDAFSFFNVARSVAERDFSWMESASVNFEDYAYDQGTETLKELNMDKVDTIVIFYDARDYINRRIGMNPDNEDDPITYRGALGSGIRMLQEKYPFIRIVCMSFPMCYAYDSTGALVCGDRYDFGNGKLTTYLQFMIDVSGATGASFIDNYYGTIHEDNSDEWMLDNIHVNAACNEHMAEHFVTAIYGDK